MTIGRISNIRIGLLATCRMLVPLVFFVTRRCPAIAFYDLQGLKSCLFPHENSLLTGRDCAASG